MQVNQYDPIGIGAGADGAVLALRVAPASNRTLLIERGVPLSRAHENRGVGPVFVEAACQGSDPGHDKHGKPFHSGLHCFVGGNLKLCGMVFLRLRERNPTKKTHVGCA